MDEVEKLARALHAERFKGRLEPDEGYASWKNWHVDAVALIRELQAPQRALIEKWRTEASRLDRDAVELARNCRDADAARRLAEAKLRRALAGELERTLEGGQ